MTKKIVASGWPKRWQKKAVKQWPSKSSVKSLGRVSAVADQTKSVVVPNNIKGGSVVRQLRTARALVQNTPGSGNGATTVYVGEVNGTLVGNTFINLRDIVQEAQSWAALSAQYDQFKITSVELDYTPFQQYASSGVNEGMDEPVILNYDPDQSNRPFTNAIAELDYEKTKIVSYVKPWALKFPIKGISYGSTATGYAFYPAGGWFDTRTPNMVAGCWTVGSAVNTAQANHPIGGSAPNTFCTGEMIISLTVVFRKAV